MAGKKAPAESKPVDLAQFDGAVEKQEAGIDVPIMGMDGRTPLGFSIKVAGPDSKRAQKAQEEMTDELIEQGHAGRLSAREATIRGIRYLARITIGWEPRVIVSEQELPYSVENAEKLYQRFPFIREQVDRAAGQRVRFLKG